MVDKQMLKAVVLAGGRGLRLSPLTDNLPKPMIEIKGKPFLHYLLDLLKKNNILRILLCVGYLSDKIIDYFGDGSHFGLDIEYSIEDDFCGTGGALKKAEHFINESFILLYADSYLPIDYAKLINFWFSCEASGLVVCYDNRHKIAKNNVYLDELCLIRSYDKHGRNEAANYIEGGVSILRKDILDIIPSDKAVSLEEEIFPVLIKTGRLKGYPISQRFYDIGTLQGLLDFQEVV